MLYLLKMLSISVSVDDSCSIFTNLLIYAFPNEMHSFLSMVFEVQWRVDSKNDVFHVKRKKLSNLGQVINVILKKHDAARKIATEIQEFRTLH